MSTDRDTTRIVQSWLRADEHESADLVLATVLAALDATPQRRSSWLARRYYVVNTYAKLAVVAAAVLVVAVIAINLLPGGTSMTGGAPSNTAASSASASPAGSTAADFPPAGALAMGRHSMIRDGVAYSIEVTSAGWTSGSGFEFLNGSIGSTDGASIIFWGATPDNVNSDPCAQTPMSPAAGPALASIAAAVSTIPGTTLVSGPTDVFVGGNPAKRVEIAVTEGIGCSATSFHLWYDEGMGPGAGRFPTVLPATMTEWIVDVDGKRIWVDAETYQETSSSLKAEIQRMVDSIRFE